MDCDAVIFDCDGVLIDSEILACRIVAEELTAVGYAISTEEVARRFAGRPEHDMRAEIEREWARTIPESYDSRTEERIAKAFADELLIVPGVVEALDSIKVPMCVASSSYPADLRRKLEKVGLYERFAPNVISGSQVERGKPAPDVFLFAAGWMKTSPRHSVVIEDSVPGTLAAVRAGIPVLGFTGASHCGPDQQQKLLDAGASTVFAEMRELPSLLAGRLILAPA